MNAWPMIERCKLAQWRGLKDQVSNWDIAWELGHAGIGYYGGQLDDENVIVLWGNGRINLISLKESRSIQTESE